MVAAYKSDIFVLCSG